MIDNPFVKKKEDINAVLPENLQIMTSSYAFYACLAYVYLLSFCSVPLTTVFRLLLLPKRLEQFQSGNLNGQLNSRSDDF